MGGDFGILTAVALALLVGALLALGRFYPGSGAELGVAAGLREQHARRQAYRASLESTVAAEQDLADLLEVTNGRRAKRGLPQLSAEGLRAELAGAPPPGARRTANDRSAGG